MKVTVNVSEDRQAHARIASRSEISFDCPKCSSGQTLTLPVRSIDGFAFEVRCIDCGAPLVVTVSR